MYLSHETSLLGLYENKWPSPVLGISLASGEYMDYPLKMGKNIVYSRDDTACDTKLTTCNYISCIEDWAVKKYMAAACPKGMWQYS